MSYVIDNSKSYKVGVKTAGDREWVYNGMRFQTEPEALRYASDLYGRWFAVKETTIVPSEDAPNTDGEGHLLPA